jgi:CHAT domain-containing protein
VRTLREMISALGDAKELNEVSSALYKSLIEPLLSNINGKELIIVPHDVLHYLPFQALVNADGRYLIEKYPIGYLSSASLLQFTKEKSRAMGDKVLALGNPDLGDPKMNLEFAEKEAKEIENLYPQATIYLEKEATEESQRTRAD